MTVRPVQAEELTTTIRIRSNRLAFGEKRRSSSGMANKQIAYALSIAEHTVKNHVKNILSKLGVQDRTQAATAAIQRGIIHL